MAIERAFSLPPLIFYPLRILIVTILLLALSRPYIHLRPSNPVLATLLGIAAFVAWIGPDVLFGYRSSILFNNAIVGSARNTADPALRHSIFFVISRVLGCVLVVPVFEELFWRGWLMRWLVKPEFLAVPFGTYQRAAFWTVAVLFAAEHGAYWEVGLAAGIAYNWWAVRSRSLADCILAHAVTNGILSAYILVSGRWEYWF